MKNTEKEISVCIPVYNVERYIERCLRSLFEQTIAVKCEFIIVDDCTPDSSIDIAKKIISSYSGIDVKIINHEINKGSAEARNTALANANGKYIIFVDSDDYVDKDYIKKLYQCCINNNADISVCDSYRVDGKKISVRKAEWGKTPAECISRLFRENKCAAMWQKLVKRSLYTEHNLKWLAGVDMGEDTIITAKLLAYTDKIGYVAEPLYYHINDNVLSLTNTTSDAKRIQLIQVNEQLESFFKNFTPEHDKLITFNNLYEDFLYLKLRLKRQIIEHVNDRKKYYSLWSETDKIVMSSPYMAFYVKFAIHIGLKYPSLAEFVFNLKGYKNKFRLLISKKKTITSII